MDDAFLRSAVSHELPVLFQGTFVRTCPAKETLGGGSAAGLQELFFLQQYQPCF